MSEPDYAALTGKDLIAFLRAKGSPTVADAKGSISSDIHKGIVETQRWMVATVIGMMVGFGGLFLAISTALKPAPAGSPIVVTIPAPAQSASRP